MIANARRALYASAAVMLLAAAALWVSPAHVSSLRLPAAPLAEPAPEPSPSEKAQALLSFQQIVESNVFARDRTPPQQRYTPPELAESESAAPTRTSEPVGFRPRLYGVAVGPSGAVALIDADPAIPGAEVYRAGDVVRGLRVVEIRETAVVLEGPNGRTVLTLPSSRGRPQ